MAAQAAGRFSSGVEHHAGKAGVAERYATRPGDAFSVDYGSGYDLVLLTNILHHFDPAGCETLLRRVHAALAPGGRAVTLCRAQFSTSSITSPTWCTFFETPSAARFLMAVSLGHSSRSDR